MPANTWLFGPGQKIKKDWGDVIMTSYSKPVFVNYDLLLFYIAEIDESTRDMVNLNTYS